MEDAETLVEELQKVGVEIEEIAGEYSIYRYSYNYNDYRRPHLKSKNLFAQNFFGVMMSEKETPSIDTNANSLKIWQREGCSLIFCFVVCFSQFCLNMFNIINQVLISVMCFTVVAKKSKATSFIHV